MFVSGKSQKDLILALLMKGSNLKKSWIGE